LEGFGPNWQELRVIQEEMKLLVIAGFLGSGAPVEGV
jgi:hypothetical protein